MIDTKRLATDAAYWRECDPSDGEATHFEPVYSDHECAWVRVDRKGLRHYFYDGGWICADKTSDDIGPISTMIPRPTKPAAPEWDGISAPAPGELAVTSGGKCQVLGWDANRSEVAVQWYDGEMGVVRLAALKAIPTKAQSDRDELADLLEPYCRGSYCGNEKTVADAIMAAGWTKP